MTTPTARRLPAAPLAAPAVWPVPISAAARLAGVSARMVRHYESLGLLQSVARTDNGYRQYTETDVHTLHFIRRARDLGFSIEEITALLALWQDRSRSSAQVKRIAQGHITQLTERIAAMQAMQPTRVCRVMTGPTALSWTTWLGRGWGPQAHRLGCSSADLRCIAIKFVAASAF